MLHRFNPGYSFRLVFSHRQELGDEESVSHPEKVHDPAVRVCWGLVGVGALLLLSLAILQRPASSRKGQMGVQGRNRGRRGRRGTWRRWRRGGAGQGRGLVPLRGQVGSWIQGVVWRYGRMFRCRNSNDGETKGSLLRSSESGDH